MEYLFALIIGLIAGMIVNILADDLPLRRAPRLPRYIPLRKKQAVRKPVFDEDGENITLQYAREDDPPRPFVAWLGITAFLFGKREAPDGTAKLSWRYPIAEIMTVAFMLLAVFAAGLLNQDEVVINDLQLAFWFVYMAAFSLIIVIDMEHKLILFAVIIPSSIIAVADAIIPGSYRPDIVEAMYGGMLGFFVFFMIYNGGFLFTYIAGRIRGEDVSGVAFGYGDVMMATLSGLLLGWQALIFATVFAIFLGSFGAIAVILIQVFQKRYSAFTAIPYGPFIVIGTMIMLLFGETLVPDIFGWSA